MSKTKDQRDLQAVLVLAKEASDAAYSLFSRRLDTRRNIESFILLRDAFNMLKDACEALREAEDKATDTKASSQTSVSDEILIRSGRATIVGEGDEPDRPQSACQVLPFPSKKPTDFPPE